MTDKQTADYNRLRSYYPYRMFFLVNDPRDMQDEPVVWAMRDKREINRVLREGGQVWSIA